MLYFCIFVSYFSFLPLFTQPLNVCPIIGFCFFSLFFLCTFPPLFSLRFIQPLNVCPIMLYFCIFVSYFSFLPLFTQPLNICPIICFCFFLFFSSYFFPPLLFKIYTTTKCLPNNVVFLYFCVILFFSPSLYTTTKYLSNNLFLFFFSFFRRTLSPLFSLRFIQPH